MGLTNVLLGVVMASGGMGGDSPFATKVVAYSPAPGQFVNHALFNDPEAALGAPDGGGGSVPANQSIVTLGGFGGTIVLGFDRTVMNDPANPFGMDAIVYSNAFWVGGDPSVRWAEAGVIEISRDVNGNGLADDPWYVIAGSHIERPASQYGVQTWDDVVGDATYPPASLGWIPPGFVGTWTTEGYLLPTGVFGSPVLANPLGEPAEEEGVFGYADCSPTATLGDMDGDGWTDDEGITAEDFYTIPDDPFVVGITPGTGGGDAFDISWAVDPVTGEPVVLDGFDFIRIRTGVNVVLGFIGEISTEIDAVAIVSPGLLGDVNVDGMVDLVDAITLVECIGGPNLFPAALPCFMTDWDVDTDVDLVDVAIFWNQFGGSIDDE